LFDNVRIPKANLLNRLSDVSDDGIFSSPIKNADARLGLSLGGLSTGRMLLSYSMLTKAMAAVKIACRFAAMRK